MLPGVFRLRVPLPWPGVPHGNAWAVACDGGFVLFDAGMPGEDSLADLERALAMCRLRLEQTRLIVCTHAHLDHCGGAAEIARQTGCEIWLHPQPRAPAADAAEPAGAAMSAGSRSRARAGCRRRR